jgi:hypothetical protein
MPGDDALADLLPRLDDCPGPARRLSSTAAAALARAAVDAALADPAAPAGAAAPRAGRPAPRTDSAAPLVRVPAAPARRTGPGVWRTLAVAAAALISLSIAAGAAALVMHWTYVRPQPAPPPPIDDGPPPVRRWQPPPPPPVEPPPVIEMPGLDLSRPRPPARPRPIAVHPAESRPPEVAVPEDAPPEDLLALANQHRRDQDWAGADRLYRAVGDRFPSSDAAVVAAVASATLRLEQLGDAAGALAGYQRALAARPAGALAEEARWGIAEAQRSLGDRRAEAAALAEFLDRHPGSALAPAARRRLAELRP